VGRSVVLMILVVTCFEVIDHLLSIRSDQIKFSQKPMDKVAFIAQSGDRVNDAQPLPQTNYLQEKHFPSDHKRNLNSTINITGRRNRRRDCHSPSIRRSSRGSGRSDARRKERR
jgi:hypothetical protein